MTISGLLIGILTGIGIIAIGVPVLVFWAIRKASNEMKREGRSSSDRTGFKLFESLIAEKLETAPVNSYVSAQLPIPSVDTYMRVAGRNGGQTFYKLEIRMGYKRTDHLDLILNALEGQQIEFTRTDKGRGLIKLLSDRTSDVDELTGISRKVRDVVTLGLSDNRIEVDHSIRKS